MDKKNSEISDLSAEEISAAVQSGLLWLLDLQEQSGEFRDCGREIAGYYKALVLFGKCGAVEAGIRCLKFIKDNLRNDSGEICSGEIKTQFSRMQRNLAHYIDGWISLGAWGLGDYSFAEDLALSLQRRQSPTLGGVATGPEKWSGRLRYDLATAACCGRTFLATGHRNQAFEAGRFLAEALKHQQNPEEGLDLCFDDAWRALDAPDPSERTYYRLLFDQRGEKVWFPAFSCAFLCEIHQISGNRTFLSAAEDYFGYIARLPEFREKSLANGKTGWAAGLLALITEERKYAEAASWIVPNVLARQSHEGEFGPSPRSLSGREGRPEIPLPRRVETTAEFTAWSAEYLRLYTLGIGKNLKE